ncbi:hypothetical protein FH972_025735 [Carpinus fangiana]|uniref:Membrane anchor Opy2 N-terminal domain-containing protein n=1 Tax=Carpinus fangiana TaxID=176857 RepID=A0A5N6L1V9_9ROSI|nr:hypothetical protein FH972_025735 [Carpinus fangiana]
MAGSYLMFHWVQGVPFEFNAGAYDNLNMWEQIDDGEQYTPTKKFLLSVPIILFLVSTHYTHYDLTYFTINLLATLAVVIPKLPAATVPLVRQAPVLTRPVCLMLTDLGVEDTFRTLFRRCVACPDTAPACPDCADDEWCTAVSPTCSQCAYRTCVKSVDTGAVNTGSNAPSSSGTNIGAVVGGVIGGIAAIALVTFIIWRFCIKSRRNVADEWIEPEKDGNSQWDARAQARASTHTVGSLASTVMTRASNVIQIAFIPGIEGRDNAEHVPPVPAVPMNTNDHNSPSSSYHNIPQDSPHSTGQDHYFMPRGSTYSGFTDDSNVRYSQATSIAPSLMTRNSMAPSISPSLQRQSVASTIFGDGNATAVGPAQTAYRGRANVVSVKPGSASGPGGAFVPDMPSIDLSKYGQAATAHQQSATQMPVLKVNGATLIEDNASSHSSNKSSALASPQEQSSAQEPARSSSHIAAQIQAATMRASKQPEHGGLGGIKRDPSPFSDENEVTTPKLE